jgi:acyl-CoA reductase-like NAD-dependent aldehyde dehydrogenase
MAITDTASHALLIDGENVETARTRTIVESFSNHNEAFAARELEAGTVWIDEHLAIGSEMPHGGVKGSGFGKDMSMYALEEYTAVEYVVSELTGAPSRDWYDAVSSR